MRHFYRENATWQIDADGVRYLADRGIRAGDSFATDVFMQMVVLGLVYTSNRPRSEQASSASAVSGSSDPELKAGAEAAFRLLYRREYSEVYKLFAPELRSSMTPEDFASRVSGNMERRVTSWKIRLVSSFAVKSEHLPGIDRIGTVVTDFKLMDHAQQQQQYLGRKELWSRADGVWFWWWRDWGERT